MQEPKRVLNQQNRVALVYVFKADAENMEIHVGKTPIVELTVRSTVGEMAHPIKKFDVVDEKIKIYVEIGRWYEVIAYGPVQR